MFETIIYAFSFHFSSPQPADPAECQPILADVGKYGQHGGLLVTPALRHTAHLHTALPQVLGDDQEGVHRRCPEERHQFGQPGAGGRGPNAQQQRCEWRPPQRTGGHGPWRSHDQHDGRQRSGADERS